MKIFLKKHSTLFLFFLLVIGGGFFYAPSAEAAVKTWTGTVSSSWNTAGNWSGGIPGSGDIATFDNTCSTCDVTIDTSPNVAGIDMKSTYAGTITQSSTYTITVGASDWVQAGGTFAGGSGAISISKNLTLSGGVFTSTNGTMTIGAGAHAGGTLFNFNTGATFNPGTGTVKLVNDSLGDSWAVYTYTLSTVIPLTLYNVEIDVWNYSPGPTQFTQSGSVVTVLNNFTHTNGQFYGGVAQWNVQGNVVIGGSADGGTATLAFTGGNAQTFTNQGGTNPTGDITINKSAGTLTLASTATWNATNQDVTLTAGTFSQGIYALSTNTLTIAGGTYNGGSSTGGTLTATAFTFSGATGTFNQNTSPVVVNGAFSQSAGTFAGSSSGTAITTQTFTLSGSGSFTSTSGTLTAGNATLDTTIFAKTGGIFTANSGKVRFYSPTYPSTVNITSDTVFNDVNVYGIYSNTPVTLTGSGVVTVNGIFTQESGPLNGGTWNVLGNVVITSLNDGAQRADGGTGLIRMYGATPTTFSCAPCATGGLQIDKDAGIGVTMASGTTTTVMQRFILSSGTFTAPSGTMNIGSRAYGLVGDIFNYSGGTFVQGTGTVSIFSGLDGWPDGQTIRASQPITFYRLSFSDNNTSTTLGPSFVLTGSGSITVTNTFTHNLGQLNGGSLNLQGNVVIASAAVGGTTQLNFTGGTAQTYTEQAGANAPDGNITINKSAGTLTLASAATWNYSTTQNVTLTAGTFSQGIYALSTNTLTLGGGTYNGGSSTGGTLTATAFTFPAGSTGVFNQNTSPVVVNGAYSQSAGTFTGSSGTTAITTQTFVLSGGTFTSTSGTLTIGGHFAGDVTIFTKSGGTFNAGTGTVRFSSYNNGGTSITTHSMVVSSALTLNNVLVDMNLEVGELMLSLAGTVAAVTVNGDFTYEDGYRLNNGTWNVQGNVSILSEAQGGSSVVRMYGAVNKTYSCATSGVGAYLQIDKDAGITVTPASGTVNLGVYGFSLTGGDFTAPSGTMTVGGPVVGDPTIFNKSGTTTFNAGTGTVRFASENGSGTTLRTHSVTITGELTLNTVSVDMSLSALYGGEVVMSLTGTITIGGDFTHEDGQMTGGTLNVQKNVTIQSEAVGGTTILNYAGGNNQIYSDASVGGVDNEPNGNITINKTGGTVSTTTGFDWNATNQNVTVTAGALVVSGAGNANLAGTGGKLTVNSGAEYVMNGTGTMNLGAGSTYSVTNNGRISMRTSGGCGGVDTLKIRSTATPTRRNWNGTGSYVMYDVNVMDMAAVPTINLLSSTIANTTGWSNTPDPICPGRAITVPSGEIDVPSGTVLVK